jgi:import receptor subunit TOM22
MVQVEELKESQEKIVLIDGDEEEYEDILEEDESFDESLLERIGALVDIVNPVTRVKIAHALEDTVSVAMTAGKMVGSGLWILASATLIVLLPLQLELERERAVFDQELNQRIQQQQAQQLMQE